MKRAICLLEYKSIGPAQENTDGLALVWAFEDFDNLFASTCRLFDNETSLAQLVLVELVDMGNGAGSNSARNKVNLVPVDVLNDHNLLLRQEMQSKVAGCFAQDALLKEQHIGTRGNNLLDKVKDVALLLL